MKKRFAQFQAKVWAFYEKNRRDLPWRNTHNAYKILISEVMLQQTQVSRVLPRYKAFIATFPTLSKLAAAHRVEVLKAWQGMGYNRRAVALHELAKNIKIIPSDTRQLIALPGIGPYTAAAIAVFAFNKQEVMIETNIRRVFIHEFGKTDDQEILKLVAQTLPVQEKTRDWYYALMDYGAFLKNGIGKGNPNRQSKHYTKQPKFEGSNRQIRGALVRELLDVKTVSPVRLAKKLGFPIEKIRLNLQQLKKEGLVN